MTNNLLVGLTFSSGDKGSVNYQFASRDESDHLVTVRFSGPSAQATQTNSLRYLANGQFMLP